MSFQFVYGDQELVLPVQFESHIEDQLLHLLGRIASPDGGENLRANLSARVADAITAVIESRANPPSDKQLKYAVAIARELSLQLPAEVLQHKEAMAEFLSRHADTYRRRKAL